MRGIRKWSFTREFEEGNGPPPTEDEATVTYEKEENQIVISGLYIDSDTSWEGCVRRISGNQDVLHVDIGVVENPRTRFAHSIAQYIWYTVEVEFGRPLPSRVMLRHISENDETQFSKTVTE